MVLAARNTTVVRLDPAGVVARVVAAEAAADGWPARELDFAAHLHRHGCRVVRPADGIPAGPHEHAGHVVTLWSAEDHERRRPLEPARCGRALREIHDAPLPPGPETPFDPLGQAAAWLDGLVAPDAGTRRRLDLVRGAHAELHGADAVLAFDRVPLHGDAHLANVLRTPAGPVWCDLENAFCGPREWDVACLLTSRAVYGAATGAGDALRAYGDYDAARAHRLALLRGVWVMALSLRGVCARGVPSSSLPLREAWLRRLVQGSQDRSTT